MAAATINMGSEQPFKRAPVRRPSGHHDSLLTMALQSQSDEEDEAQRSAHAGSRRRQSIGSNLSRASTAELTCSTGVTTPARTSSPSPHRLSAIAKAHLVSNLIMTTSTRLGQQLSVKPINSTADVPAVTEPAARVPEKKRCISFACAAKPLKAAQQPAGTAATTIEPPPSKPISSEAPRKPCIRFACAGKPVPKKTASPPTREDTGSDASRPIPAIVRDTSPAAVRKHRSPSVAKSRPRSSTPRRTSQSPTLHRAKKYLTANTKELQNEGSRFHEFASETPQEDDWIRQDPPLSKAKITIDDTLQKENQIRKLAKEAEEEAELEEEEAEEYPEATPDGEDGDNLDNGDDIGKDDEVREDSSGYGSDDDSSEGYRSDNEGGLSDSDAEDENDDLRLWTLSHGVSAQFSDATPVCRQPPLEASLSDSSRHGRPFLRPGRSTKHKRPVTPELPDSTDFVCGTLDEDRPLEEAYVSRIAAKKCQNVRTIPQDIDPSFPTSDPEDEDIDATGRGQNSDEPVWLHGEIEDLHHGQDTGRRKKSMEKTTSPRRYHSPPPPLTATKRRASPAPRVRGRSPSKLFERHSPEHRRCHSPAPLHDLHSPPASPVSFKLGQNADFKTLAFRPGLTHTKSLPRTPIVAPALRCRRGRAGIASKVKHVRGAVDIVLGLEQKRQRRKEKCYQKHCNRARKGQVPEKRPMPGQGAVRMKEVGLLMAGKIPGNFVLSV